MKQEGAWQGPSTQHDDAAGWPYLIEAQRHACHSMLVQLNLAHRGLMVMESMRQEDVDDAIPDEMDD